MEAQRVMTRLLSTLLSRKQDVMSHKMDARIKDGAMMEKRVCCGFFLFSTRQVQEAEYN